MSDRQPVLLVVEDEPEVLRINARILARRGYTVYTAESCRRAYERLAEIAPDLLILDIMLPDGSGYDICDKFRQTSDHPVIFLTGKSETQDKIEGLGRGGDYYLTKPYDTDELLAVVSRLIKRYLETKQKHRQITEIIKGPLSLDIPKARAAVNGVDAGLTAKEFALLLELLRNEDKKYGAFPPGAIHAPSASILKTYAKRSMPTIQTIMISFRFTGRAICLPRYDKKCRM